MYRDDEALILDDSVQMIDLYGFWTTTLGNLVSS